MKKKSGKLGFLKRLYKYRVYLLMLAPAIIYTLIFSYYPMTGVVLAFKKYNYAGGIWGSPWNGLDNFKFFFQSGQAGLVTKNTVLYNSLFIVVNTVLQIAVAVLLTEIKNKHYRKISQSLMFLPYFISWVIVGVMAFNILSNDYGFLNRLIEGMGGTRISFYTTPEVWPWILTFFNVFQRIFKITIPSIMPTTIILFLMSVGGIFKGSFDMFYNLVGSNGLLYNYTDVIDTLTFRALISNSDYGMSAAMGLYQSVLCFATVLIANKLVALVCFIPFLMVVSGSFSSEAAITEKCFSILPQDFSLEAYKTVFQEPMVVVRAYITTIGLTIVGTVLGLLLQTMMAYVLSRKDFEWRNFFSFFFYFTTLFSGGLVPYYILNTQTLDIDNTYLALLLPLLFSVYNLMIMKSYITALPESLIDAAKIDGCGEFMTLFRIVMPLIKPALATVGLFIALAYWNDWYNAIPESKEIRSVWQSWTIEASEGVEIQGQEGRLCAEALRNFKFSIRQQVPITESGKYALKVDFQGTDTTNVDVRLFAETAAGWYWERVIHPSEHGYTAYGIRDISCGEELLTVGIKIESPPMHLVVKNFQLLKQS